MSDVSATFTAINSASCFPGSPCDGVNFTGITTMQTDELGQSFWIIDTSFKMSGPLYPRNSQQALVIYWVVEVADSLYDNIKSEWAMNRWGNYSITTQEKGWVFSSWESKCELSDAP